MKKLLCLLTAVLMVFILCAVPVIAADNYNIVQPGNPRSKVPVYNYAWLDNIILRDDAMAVTGKEIIPVPEDYPGRLTFSEFVSESNSYAELYALSEDISAGVYDDVIEALYYVVVAMGMTDSLDTMRSYLASEGIMLSPNEAVGDKAKIAVVYAAMKFDAVYVLYGKPTEVPVGSTLDSAVITILASLTGVYVPSGIDTIPAFAMHIMENYVSSFDQLPISDDPDAQEIIYWTKVLTAAGNDYQVPLELYSETSNAQREYVDYAYYASMLSTLYDVKIDPFKLVLAEQSGEAYALQELILKTMFEEKNIAYSDNLSCEEMFNIAAENGCFALENELYCDILKYDVLVGENCEKLWFTPFPVAGQVGDSKDTNVSMYLNGEYVASGSTTLIALDPAKAEETVTLEIYYTSEDRNESATYEFTVIKSKTLNVQGSTAENDIVAQVQDYVNSVIPTDSEKANAIVDSIFEAADSALSNNDSVVGEGTLTTYPQGDTSGSVSADENKTTSGFNFEYLDELMNGLYETDADGNIVSSYIIGSYGTEDDKQENILVKTVETVKENPEIVVAPTGLVAVGALAGYLMSKKHKISEAFSEDEEAEDTEEE